MAGVVESLVKSGQFLETENPLLAGLKAYEETKKSQQDFEIRQSELELAKAKLKEWKSQAELRRKITAAKVAELEDQENMRALNNMIDAAKKGKELYQTVNGPKVSLTEVPKVLDAMVGIVGAVNSDEEYQKVLDTYRDSTENLGLPATYDPAAIEEWRQNAAVTAESIRDERLQKLQNEGKSNRSSGTLAQVPSSTEVAGVLAILRQHPSTKDLDEIDDLEPLANAVATRARDLRTYAKAQGGTLTVEDSRALALEDMLKPVSEGGVLVPPEAPSTFLGMNIPGTGEPPRVRLPGVPEAPTAQAAPTAQPQEPDLTPQDVQEMVSNRSGLVDRGLGDTGPRPPENILQQVGEGEYRVITPPNGPPQVWGRMHGQLIRVK